MKYLIVYITLFIAGISCFAQDVLKVGAFYNIEEYKNKSPSLDNVFIIKKRTVSDIKWNGGNDYKVESNGYSFNKKTIKKKIWAINRGDSLFINGMKLGLGLWYVKALTQGRYICLEGWIPISKELLKELRQKNLYQPVGGLMGQSEYYRVNSLRFLYVYDLALNKLRLLDEKNLQSILEASLDLHQSFMAEPIKSNKTFLKYIELINRK